MIELHVTLVKCIEYDVRGPGRAELLRQLHEALRDLATVLHEIDRAC